jgi:hypothetical protein
MESNKQKFIKPGTYLRVDSPEFSGVCVVLNYYEPSEPLDKVWYQVKWLYNSGDKPSLPIIISGTILHHYAVQDENARLFYGEG